MESQHSQLENSSDPKSSIEGDLEADDSLLYERIENVCTEIFKTEVEKFNKFCGDIEFNDVLELIHEKGIKWGCYGLLIDTFVIKLPPELIVAVIFSVSSGVSAGLLRGADDFADFVNHIVTYLPKGFKLAVGDLANNIREVKIEMKNIMNKLKS